MKKVYSFLLILCALLVLIGCSGSNGSDSDNSDGVAYDVAFDLGDGLSMMISGAVIQKEPTPTKEGYRFEGWYEDINLNGARLTFPYTPANHIRLYAKWTALFDVIFNANGGVIGGEPTFTLDNVSSVASNQVPIATMTGNTFDGWYKDTEFVNKVEFPYEVTADITLYAKWLPIPPPTYNVTFEENGGSAILDLNVSVIEVEPESTKDGYRFDGWFANVELNGNKMDFPYYPDQDVTLYAKWTAVFDVTFDANDGLIGDESELVLMDVEFISTDQVPTATRDGYTFDGWYEDPDFSGAEIEFPYYPEHDITLYAEWLPIPPPTYNVTFVENGGSAVTDLDVSVIEVEPASTRDGYRFDGWFANVELSGNKMNFPYYPDQDVTLYAKWTAIFDVTFDANGGTMDGEPELADVEFVAVDQVPVVKKKGQIFDGWYDSNDNKIIFPYYPNPDVYLDRNVALRAKWTQKATYRIDFYLHEDFRLSRYSQDVPYNDSSSFYWAPDPDETCWILVGWQVNGEGEVYNAQNPYTPEDDTDFYAKLSGKMVSVGGGTFTMGSPNTEGYRNDDETQHAVNLSSFSISQCEVVQSEWDEVKLWADENGYVLVANPSYDRGDNVAVGRVTWYDAIRYCNIRSIMEGLTPVYYVGNTNNYIIMNGDTVSMDRSQNGYRLPTEAEWEYAARGGQPGKNEEYMIYSGSNTYGEISLYFCGSGAGSGGIYPNILGLYNMSGNIEEWVWDWYGLYPNAVETDPTGATSGDLRVQRGGSCSNYEQYSRSAYRYKSNPTALHYDFGFRVVRPFQ